MRFSIPHELRVVRVGILSRQRDAAAASAVYRPGATASTWCCFKLSKHRTISALFLGAHQESFVNIFFIFEFFNQ